MPLLLQWLERLNYLPSHYASQEPVLALHQQLYGIIRNYGTNSNNQTAQTELTKHTALVLHRSVELSRASGSYSVALSSLLQAETSNPRLFQLHPALHHERAQVLWESNNKFEATKYLQRAVNAMYRAIEAAVKGVIGPPPSVPDPLDLVMPADNVKAAQFKAAYTNAVVDLAEWQGELHEANIMTIVGHYEKVMRVQEDGKVHYALGKFYDNILKAAIEKSQQISDPAKDLTNRAVQYDIQYLFQALPRLLMVWMDFGQMVLSPPDCEDSRIKERFNNSNRIMSNLARRLPAYNFLMVFSQIVSRICHPNPDVLAIIERIIRSVLLLYPQQGLWQLSAVSRSRYQVRANRCSSIISKVLADPEAEVGLHTPHSLIQHVTKLNQKLLELCNKSVGSRSVTTLSMARDFPSLNRMAPIEVIVPIQSSLIPKFPTYSDNTVTSSYLTSVRLHSSRNGGDLATPEAGTLTQHIRARMFKPFPSTLATISGFRDRVELINSLVRPKRITIVGSDGREYSFLCKPKDDLRKDSRLMEFNSMINQFLKTDLESRKRGLHIRTYSVVPLNEECGLIEWVNYTVGIRRVLVKLYREKGLTVPNSVVKGILELNKPSPEEIFLKKLLPK
ncbi:hypothetical protein EV182_004255 [Spiromyces aspiralis]|uniref:Uncharacterized protein n=1 Tax=Spiromyces aspiralis TaxID=68401 RepID=A0ACC1HWS5_9FUNG|nr:hypothetical protein EV182_004255 [Spiromyces aspiralis]